MSKLNKMIITNLLLLSGLALTLPSLAQETIADSYWQQIMQPSISYIQQQQEQQQSQQKANQSQQSQNQQLLQETLHAIQQQQNYQQAQAQDAYDAQQPDFQPQPPTPQGKKNPWLSKNPWREQETNNNQYPSQHYSPSTNPEAAQEQHQTQRNIFLPNAPSKPGGKPLQPRNIFQ